MKTTKTRKERRLTGFIYDTRSQYWWFSTDRSLVFQDVVNEPVEGLNHTPLYS